MTFTLDPMMKLFVSCLLLTLTALSYAQDKDFILTWDPASSWNQSAPIKDKAVIEKIKDIVNESKQFTFPNDGNLYTTPPLEYCILNPETGKTMYAFTTNCRLVWNGDKLMSLTNVNAQELHNIFKRMSEK